MIPPKIAEKKQFLITSPHLRLLHVNEQNLEQENYGQYPSGNRYFLCLSLAHFHECIGDKAPRKTFGYIQRSGEH
jgi:hypothetical protein